MRSSLKLGGIISRTLLWTLGPIFLGLVWLYSYSGPISFQRLQYSPYLLDSQGEFMHILLARDDRYRIKATRSDADGHYLDLLLAYEDSRFYRHSGVDWLAMARAVAQFGIHGYVVSGGSTLTMQTVRLLEPKSRTIWNKVDEIRKAIHLERENTKDEILSMYLSLAPFGGNIEGVQMASRSWFDKWAKDLTPSEAALLVALPQSPESRRPDRYRAAAKSARNRVLERAFNKGIITRQYMDSAVLSPIPSRLHPLPKHSPHLVWKRALNNIPTPESTLNGEWQRRINAIAKDVSLDYGVNMGILVVESKTGNILSYVGSQEYLDFSNHGAVDYIEAVRSPGSSLKPFIYALAESDRVIHYEMLIKDEAVNMSGYRPQNMNKNNQGNVTIKEALQRSLNIPAVKVLQRYGPLKFKAKLSQAGINLRNGDGLPIALGGAGVTLWELVQLYGSLANGGEVLSLHAEPVGDLNHPVSKLLTSNSAAQTNWILSHNVGGNSRLHGSHRSQDLVYKTGTGPGGSDALSIGTNGKYTVGVWIGTHDGSHKAGNTGYDKAVPVMNRIFDILPQGRIEVSQPAQPPNGLLHFEKRDESKLKVLYPVDDSVIVMRNNMARVPLSLPTAHYPIVVKINNSELLVLRERSDFMEFDKPGGYALSIVDSDGRSANISYFIQ